jgi:hypothetical protein
MLAEAAATGKPLLIYPIPEKPLSAKARLQRAIFQCAAAGRGALGRFCAGLIAGGWITPPRDLALMHREMIAHGLAEAFGADVKDARPLPAPGPGDGPDDWQALLDRVRTLVAR